MKAKFIVSAIAVVAAFFTVKASAQESVDFTTHTRVGNGWHMYTTVCPNDNGSIQGKTTLKNYNNFRGFAGGLFVVALDENNTPLYSTKVHKWGVNASFFKRKKVRNASWSDQIPEEYLGKIAKVSVVQMHTPTNRVWQWVFNNKDLIIRHAKYVAEIFEKIKNNEFTGDDALDIVEAHF